MGWTPEQELAFVADHLGPTLDQAGYNELKMMILDDQREFGPEWANAVSDLLVVLVCLATYRTFCLPNCTLIPANMFSICLYFGPNMTVSNLISRKKRVNTRYLLEF